MAMREIAGTLEVGRLHVVKPTASAHHAPPTAVRRFGSFAFDVRSRELRSGDGSVILQAQSFEVLRLLLERAGHVVDRDEFRQRLWPDGTFVDYEHSLNAAMKRLRNLLGDDAQQPRFIETIPRRGYRFIAPVFGNAAISPRRWPLHANAVRLAVLPFVDLGAKTFADGLSEELRAQLGRLTDGIAAVLARSSSTALHGQSRRASEIGEELGVEYLVEGSAQSDGDRVRIRVSLVETLNETLVWSETAECRLAGPLSAIVEVATRLAQSLARKLLATV